MDISRIKKNFPIFKKLPLEKESMRRPLGMLFLAGAFLSAILAFNVYSGMRSSREQQLAEGAASLGKQEPVHSSVSLSTPEAVENDAAAGASDQLTMYERTRPNFGEKVYEEAGRKGAVDPGIDGSLAAKDSIEARKRVSSLKEGTPSLKDSPSGLQGGPTSSGNPLIDAVHQADGVQGPSLSSSSENEELRKARQQAEEARKRLIAAGIDPDTGKPFIQPSPSSQTLAPQPSTAAATDNASGSSSPATPSEDPFKSVPRVVVRSSGGVSSLGSGWEDSSESVGSINSVSSPEPAGEAAHPFKVMFSKDEKLSSGDRVTLRLLEEMLIDDVRLPENSPLSGIVSISGNRLHITVNSVKIGDRIFALNFVAYDTDAEQGIYCRQTDAARGLRQGVDEAGSVLSSALVTGIAGYSGRLVSSGASILRSTNGNETVHVSSGYQFFLIRNQN